jgi:hypothetical protein
VASESKNSYILNNSNGIAGGAIPLNGKIVAHPLQAVKPSEPQSIANAQNKDV